FSSRRRHTRSYGDWSSDVCSSDLVDHLGGDGAQLQGQFTQGLEIDFLAQVDGYGHHIVATLMCQPVQSEPGFKIAVERENGARRSEERRVGKECRTWDTRK